MQLHGRGQMGRPQCARVRPSTHNVPGPLLVRLSAAATSAPETAPESATASVQPQAKTSKEWADKFSGRSREAGLGDSRPPGYSRLSCFLRLLMLAHQPSKVLGTLQGPVCAGADLCLQVSMTDVPRRPSRCPTSHKSALLPSCATARARGTLRAGCRAPRTSPS